VKRLQRAALVTALVKEMRDQGSWCGETHVQKAAFLLESLFGVDLGYDFVLYRHGPFSFDLRDELEGFASDRLIRYEPQAPPYGPRISVTQQGQSIQETYPQTLGRNAGAIRFVAAKIDARGVVNLERLATALYVTLQNRAAPEEERTRMLRMLKPHISEPAALEAVREIDQIRAEAEALAA
jgi:hypothetical protein